MTLRVVFIGCVESSRIALESLLAVPGVEVVGVVSRAASSFNADFVALAPLADAHAIPRLEVDAAEEKAAMAAWIAARAPDVIYCIGWSWLLPPSLLALPPLGVVGFHPAALPRNRGRHPIVWALALGLEETASSFFFMQADADSGDLLSQRAVPIAYADDAASLYARICAAMREQIPEFTAALRDGTLQARPQDAALATAWRKRTAEDGQIDWRMPAEGIRNLVRALARPYPGAHFMHGGQAVKLWRCEVVDCRERHHEPGKVLEAGDGRLVIKCGDAAVALLEHELQRIPQKGDYL